ncbi:hypothetical protein TSUD_289450 [Trifolium subterraneum]|uniref:Uncharacterized protein n=1 Tax=Trifolium subterraneum TaxID=3900 RepID=A0A2Z6MMD7_TRISU|nr:hypothetical protein TSUD_289450 [Trifolium subterraneum]
MGQVPGEGYYLEMKSQNFQMESQYVSFSLSQESIGKEHYKFHNTTVENNDQPQSMSCDFTPIAPPQVPVTSHEVHREVTEAKEHHEARNLVLIQMISNHQSQWSCMAMLVLRLTPKQKFVETETSDESSKTEVEMNVLTNDSEKTKLPKENFAHFLQVSVYLTCECDDKAFKRSCIATNVKIVHSIYSLACTCSKILSFYVAAHARLQRTLKL